MRGSDREEKNVKLYLEANPDVLEEVRGKLMDHILKSRAGDDPNGGLRVDEDGVVIE